MASVKVLIDARYCREERTGVGTYSRNLLQALDNALDTPTDSIEIFAILLDTKKNPAPELNLRNIKIITTNADYRSHPHNEVWLNFTLPGLITQTQANVFHNLAYSIPWRKKISCKKLVSIHDLIVYEMPGNYPWLFETYLKWMIRRAVKSADKIVVFSEYVLQALLKKFNLQPHYIEKIPHGVSPVFSPLAHERKAEIRKQLNLPDSYIFSVGSSEQRKNLTTLIKAFRQLKKEHSLPHTLIIALSDKLKRRSPLQQLVESLRLKDEVNFINVQSAEMMRDYYNCAELFVFTSRNEGFGLPVLEAMASGVPVLCSNIAPLSEIVGNCAERFEFDDYITLARKMYNLIIDEGKRQELVRCGLERAKLFNWHNSACKYLNLYLELADIR